MSETAATPPQPSLWQEEVRATLHGVGAAWQMLRTRKVRTPLPRVPMDQTVELLCLFLLACGVVAGTMVLVDPLVSGLRARLPRNSCACSSASRTSASARGAHSARCRLPGAARHPAPVRSALPRVAAAVVARLGFLILSVTGVSLFVLVVKYALGRARRACHDAAGPAPAPHLRILPPEGQLRQLPLRHSAWSSPSRWRWPCCSRRPAGG